MKNRQRANLESMEGRSFILGRVIIAVLFLGERASRLVWIGVGGGFVGVLLVMRPQFEQFNTGNLYAKFSTFRR